MEIIHFLIIIACGAFFSESFVLEKSEPQCYSRFDYEYKVIQNLVTLKTTEQELRNMIAELQSTVKDLQTKVKDPVMVGFSVHLRNRVTTGGLRPTIKFEHVVTNVGNGYDVNTGIFTAPVPGLYFFSAELASPSNARFYLMFNGTVVTYLFTIGANTKWESSSESITLKLELGDKVWVNGLGTIEGYEPHNCQPTCYHSSFAGFLIQSE